MNYIIMAIDECGDEICPSRSKKYPSEAQAIEDMIKLKESHQEYRGWWVELLRDKAYYTERRLQFEQQHPGLDPSDMQEELF